MNHLPPELLHRICLSLHADGLNSRTTLSNFSRLNHTCHGIAAPFLYQHLSIIFWDPQSLRKAVSELTENGQGRQFVKYARKLSIICLDPCLDDEGNELLWNLEGHKNPRYDQEEPATKDTFLESHLTDPRLSDAYRFYLLRGWSSYKELERDCGPLVALIACLCHLREIDFLVEADFPICLQKAISQHHPKCQLNIWWKQNLTSILESLKEQASPRVENQMTLSEGCAVDLGLLRLQNLHTLSVEIPRFLNGKSGWIEVDEMLPFLVLGPNLKHLILKKDFMPHQFSITELKEEWHRLAVITQPVPISSLRSISIARTGPHENILLRLADIVDISQLRSLELPELFDSAMLARVAEIFPNLERLFISMNGYSGRFPDANNDYHIGIAGILAFNPLKFLHVKGVRSVSSLNQITERHGPSLKGLIIQPSSGIRATISPGFYGYTYPELDSLGISQLSKSCPQLEELRLPIRRSMGSQEECEIYKAVGIFSNLHSLVLDLHFDPRPRPPYPGGNQLPEPSVTRTIFVNATMDEKLALQIWHLISSNQASGRLRNLRVMPFGHDQLPKYEHWLVDWFSRSFLITRYNFHNVGVPTVSEIGKREREIRNQLLFQEIDGIYVSEELQQVLSDLWPSESGYTEWKSVRSSFPLQSNDA